MEPKRLDDSFGDPVEFSAGWQFSGHESRSDAEKDELARAALEEACKQVILERRAKGKNIEFDHVQLIRNENQGSETKKKVTGERTHRAWGTGIGYLYYTVP